MAIVYQAITENDQFIRCASDNGQNPSDHEQRGGGAAQESFKCYMSQEK